VLSRLYAALFVALILGGTIFQRRYMASSAAELELIELRMQTQTELLSARDFVMDRYENGGRTDRVSAEEGVVMTDGQIVLKDDIWFMRYDGFSITSRVHTQEAFGNVDFPESTKKSKSSIPFIDTGTSLQRFHLPQEVVVYLNDGILRSDNVFFDFPKQNLYTASAVTFRSKDQHLNGRGMSYQLKSGAFELGGPVSGEFNPAAQKRDTGGKGDR
jgi:hypothetical protein